jgi:hypothetical protein
MKKFVTVAAVMVLSCLALGCTENQRARQWGGESNIQLKCDQKLFDVTWKRTDLWYATRAMRDNETPETYLFAEDSSWGMMEGTVKFVETKCKK